MPVTKGKLSAEDQSRLDQNYSYLLNQLDATYVVDRFIDEGVFDTSDSEYIRSKATTKEKNRALLDTLNNAGPTAYKVFKEILTADYDFIVEKLDRTTPMATDDRSRGEILRDELTDELKAHRMTELNLLYFARSFSTAIYFIAPCLDISKTEVEQIQLSNSYAGAVNHNQSMMIKWRNKTGRAATLSALLEAFIMAEKRGGEINWDFVEKAIKEIKL